MTGLEAGPARTWLVGYLVLRGAVVALLGTFLLLRPHDTVDALATFAGVVLLAFGAIDVVAALVAAPESGRRGLILARGP